MTDDTEISETDGLPAKPPGKSKLMLLIGFALMIGLGIGGFFAVQAGLLFGAHDSASADGEPGAAEALPDIAFVPVEAVIVSLSNAAGNRHLRFAAQLEVAKEHEAEVQLLLPRVLDVFNSYLRAVEIADLEKPTALVKLRAQLVRRVQLIAGEGRVRDLLVTEFVIN